jgi:hypothetical protein
MKTILYIILLTALTYGKSTIAVLPFEPVGITEEHAAMIGGKYEYEVFHADVYTLVERSEIEKVLSEQNFQQSNCENAVQIGKILGAEKVIIGKFGRFSITAKLIDVKTGKVERIDFIEGDLPSICHSSVARLFNLEQVEVEPYIKSLPTKQITRHFVVCCFCNGSGYEIMGKVKRACGRCGNTVKYSGPETSYRTLAGRWVKD